MRRFDQGFRAASKRRDFASHSVSSVTDIAREASTGSRPNAREADVALARRCGALRRAGVGQAGV